MPKLKYKDIKAVEDEAFDTRRFYENKYFGLFLNAYKFTNLSKNQQRYLLTRLWKAGTICAFIVEGSQPDPSLKQLLTNQSVGTITIGNENPNGVLVLCPYATNQWTIENEPSVVSYVNTRGASFIPQGLKKVNKDCVIGWAHSSHSSVYSLVSFYIERIVDVEKTINMNLFVHKLPRLVVCSPEDRARVEDLMDSIERGEKKLFLDAQDVQAIKNVLESGSNTNYIIDKLYQYKQNLENELLTFLGINNVPVEKKERLITDEAQSNDQLINDSSDCFLDCLNDFCDEVSRILKYPIKVEAKSSPASNEEPQIEEEQEESEEEQND